MAIDILVVGMDGLALLSRLKRMEKMNGVPVVIVTTEGDQGKIMEAVELGAASYFRKPFTAEQIKEGIAKLLP